ncbi:MAG: tagatose 1,6-diphosphate aldolase [Hyphomicrobiales bacterium]|nr:tagatose 1,6-diphosphate aldolase [Hyphomicrobiales bacterium]
MQLSAGKLWSLRRLADPGGRFKMTAVDQRPPFFKLIRDKRATDQVDYADVVALKVALARTLAPLSSAMLLDPVWAYPNAIDDVRPSQGLILTLEDHAFDEDAGGRRSRPIGDWSVEKIKRLGADGVKVLIWYRPDADPAVCAHQEAFVEAVGRACAAHDLCFVLELLVYPFAGAAGPDAVDDPAARPGLVVESLRRFTDPRFGVDLFKLESPVAADLVPDPDRGPGAADCQAWFDRMGALTTRPWVMLSAGADMEAFRRILVYAYRAGASGYLCGRAIWWRAAQNFPDMAALERALTDEGIAYMREINALTDDLAAPWTDHGAFAGGALLADAGPDFVHAYGRA